MLRDLLLRCRALFWRSAVRREIDEELRFHLDRQVEAYQRAGLSVTQAARRAHAEFGDLTRVREDYQDALGVRVFDEVWRDARLAGRTLRKSPGFAAAAVLTFTLGIGAATLVFSIVNGVLLRPLPILEPDRVMFVQRLHGTGQVPGGHSYPDFRELQERNAVFDGLAGFSQFPVAFDIGAGVSREMPYFVTGNYFEVLGVKPWLGRLLTPGDDRDSAVPAVVLSYDFWAAVHHADPKIVGTTLRLTAGRAAGGIADKAFVVVGVAPKGFYGTEVSVRAPAWMPLHTLMPENRLAARELTGPSLLAFGRLKPGVSRTIAQINVSAIAKDLASEFPATSGGYRVAADLGVVRNWSPVREFGSSMLFLASLVLLTACANIATSLTARTIDRQHEIGIRISLGAGRIRVVRQMLIEALVVAGVSAGLALALVWWATHVLSRFTVPGDPPWQFDVQPDARVFVVATGLSILAAVVATIAPARVIATLDPNRALKGLVGPFGLRRWTTRDLFTAAQVVFSSVLMAACVLSIVGMRRALSLPLGFDAQQVATVTLDFDVARYSREQQRSFMERAVHEVRRLPGVDGAAYTTSVPLSSPQVNRAAYLEGQPPAGQPPVPVVLYAITGDYFNTMGIRLLAGRDLAKNETRRAIVNETFVRQVLHSGPPLGAHVIVSDLYLATVPEMPLEIVGVVADGKYRSLTESSLAAIFTPMYDTPFGRPTMVVRSSAPPSSMAATMRLTLRALDPRLPVRNVGSAEQLLAPAFLPMRAATLTLTAFGLGAMLLALTGIHAVISYAVSRRRREIGVRVALGASGAHVARLVLGRIAAISIVGVVLGLMATVALRRVLERIVYLASPHEPMVAGWVAIVMLVMVVSAMVMPMIRSLRIPPIITLRSE